LESTNVSGAYRAFEIILGIVAIAISVLTLVYPELALVTIVFLFGVALLVIGFLRLGTSAFSKGLPDSARAANAIIGVIAVIIAVVVLFYPELATLTLILLLAIGLLIYGVGRIAFGGVASALQGWLRALLILMGFLMIIFAIIVIIYPAVGVVTLAIFISIGFLFIGIDSLASGIAGAS
jgi:uncharacterized membrane protein HdeD (DUF308 family)